MQISFLVCIFVYKTRKLYLKKMDDFDVLLRHVRHKNKTFASPYRVLANGIIIEKIIKMRKRVTMYQMVCDRCGYILEVGDINAFADKDYALDCAMDDEWVEVKRKHYCPKCYSFDDKFNPIVKDGGD